MLSLSKLVWLLLLFIVVIPTFAAQCNTKELWEAEKGTARVVNEEGCFTADGWDCGCSAGEEAPTLSVVTNGVVVVCFPNYQIATSSHCTGIEMPLFGSIACGSGGVTKNGAGFDRFDDGEYKCCASASWTYPDGCKPGSSLADSATPTIQLQGTLAFTMTLPNSHLCYTAKAESSPTAAVCAAAGTGTGPSSASDTPACTNAGTQVSAMLLWSDATLNKVSVIECANGGSTAIGIAEEITVTARTLADAAAPTIQVNDNIAFTMTLPNSHLCYTAKAGTLPTAAVCGVAASGTGPSAASETPVCTAAGTQVAETLVWGDATLTKVSIIECANGGSTAIGIAEEITVTARTLANAATTTIQVNDNIAFTMTLPNSHLCYTAKAGTSPTAAVCGVAASGTGPSAASDTPVCTDAGTQVAETLVWGDATLTKVSVIECANGGSTVIVRALVAGNLDSVVGNGVYVNGPASHSLTIDSSSWNIDTQHFTTRGTAGTYEPVSSHHVEVIFDDLSALDSDIIIEFSARVDSIANAHEKPGIQLGMFAYAFTAPEIGSGNFHAYKITLVNRTRMVEIDGVVVLPAQTYRGAGWSGCGGVMIGGGTISSQWKDPTTHVYGVSTCGRGPPGVVLLGAYHTYASGTGDSLYARMDGSYRNFTIRTLAPVLAIGIAEEITASVPTYAPTYAPTSVPTTATPPGWVVQAGGNVVLPKSTASGRICWSTGTTGTPAAPDCTATTNGAETAVGSLATVVCSADSTSATVDLTWDVATQVKITAIECSAANADVGAALTYTVTARTPLADSATPTIQVNDKLTFTMTLANSHLCYTAKAGTSPSTAMCAASGSGTGPSAANDTSVCTGVGINVTRTLVWGDSTLTKISVIECASGGSTPIGIAEEVTVTAPTSAPVLTSSTPTSAPTVSNATFCNEGYTGAYCDTCAERFHRVHGICASCTYTTLWGAFALPTAVNVGGFVVALPSLMAVKFAFVYTSSKSDVDDHRSMQELGKEVFFQTMKVSCSEWIGQYFFLTLTFFPLLFQSVHHRPHLVFPTRCKRQLRGERKCSSCTRSGEHLLRRLSLRSTPRSS
jgi:hypothetical protein